MIRLPLGLSAGLVCLAAMLLPSGTSAQRSTSVPVPAVERITAPGTPLGASPEPLQARGYVEEEFVIRGHASRYRISDSVSDGQLIDSGHPYVTRALVRRPADPARFNGTVVVEWYNVSAGQDIDFVYAATRELLLRDGYAWIGVSAQRVGVDRLAKWNAARYGKLSVAASNKDPRDGADIDRGTSGAPAIGGDVLGWDVFSHVGAAARTTPSPLLGGLTVKQLIAVGESQSAFRLTTYYNAIQPLHRVYDGVLFYDRAGALRADVPTKVVNIGTEFMNVFLKGSPQPDTATRRSWEIAGASHVSFAEVDGYLDAMVRRDGALTSIDGRAQSLTDQTASAGCAVMPIWSRVPNGDVLKAALKGLTSWIAGGPAPATVPRLAVAADNTLVRDAYGRVSGGLRTAAYDAPRSKNVGAGSGSFGCVLAGSHVDFDAKEMCRRYGNRDGYVARVRAAIDSNVKDGVLLPEEAKLTLDDAQAVAFACVAQ